MAMLTAAQIDALLEAGATDEQLMGLEPLTEPMRQCYEPVSIPAAATPINISFVSPSQRRTITNPSAKRSADTTAPPADDSQRGPKQLKQATMPMRETADALSSAKEIMDMATVSDEDGSGETMESILSSLDEKQRKVVQDILDGHHVFMTGVAGTGKTRVTNAAVRGMILKGLPFAVVSHNGIAATLVNGSTIHSFAGIGAVSKPPFKSHNEEAKARIRGIRVLFIDEISTCSHHMLDGLNLLFMKIRKNRAEPFGGVQVVSSGDFLQLRPINKAESSNIASNYSRHIPEAHATGSEPVTIRQRFDELSADDKAVLNDPGEENKYAFFAKVWPQITTRKHVLRNVYRQRDDPRLLKLLDEVRYGHISQESVEVLRSRMVGMTDDVMLPDRTFPNKYTVLFSLNKDVTEYNERKLMSIDTDKGIVYKAVDKVEHEYFRQKLEHIPFQKEIHLKVGAEVMLRKNISKSLANGLKGVIVGFTEVWARDCGNGSSKSSNVYRPIRGTVFDRAPHYKTKEPFSRDYHIPAGTNEVPLDEYNAHVCPREILNLIAPPDGKLNKAGSREYRLGSMELSEHHNSLIRRLDLSPVPVVRFVNGEYIAAVPLDWRYEEYRSVRGTDKNGRPMQRVAKVVLAYRVQVPLTLAWAMTIHGCQGMTLEWVCIDLGESIFEMAQACADSIIYFGSN